MSSPLNYTSYQFLIANFTKDELVAIQKGDTPGYLKAKLQQLGAYFTESYIVSLIGEYSGTLVKFVWKRSLTTPATPEGDDPAGTSYGDWQDNPYESDGTIDHLWMSTAVFNNVTDTLIGVWSDPVRLDGTSKEIRSVYRSGDSGINPPDSGARPVGNDPAGATPPNPWFDNEEEVPDYENDIYLWVSRGVFEDDELVGQWGVPTFVRRTGIGATMYAFKRAPKTPVPDEPIGPTSPEISAAYGDWQWSLYDKNEGTYDKLWLTMATIIGDEFAPGSSWSTPVIIDGDTYSQYHIQAFRYDDSIPADPPTEELDEVTLNGAGWYFNPDDATDYFQGTGPRAALFVSVIKLEATDGVIEVEEDWSTPVQWSGYDGDDGTPGIDVQSIQVAHPPLVITEANTGDPVPNVDPIPVVIDVQGLEGDATITSSDLDGGSLVPGTYPVIGGVINLDIPYDDIASFPADIDISVGAKTITHTILAPVRVENSVSIQLSNDNHTFSVPSSGIIEAADYPAGNCTIEVFRGSHKLEYAATITSSDHYTIQTITDININIVEETVGTDRVLKPGGFNSEVNALVTFEVVVPSWGDHTVQRIFHKQVSYGKASHLPDYENTILQLNNQITQLESDKEDLEIQILNVRDTLDNTSMLQGLVAQALSSNPQYFRDVLNVAEK